MTAAKESLRIQLQQEDEMDLTDQLEALRTQIFSLGQTGGSARERNEALFCYATMAIKTKDPVHIKEGLQIFETLLIEDQKNIEYLYSKALAQYKLKTYVDSRNTISKVLEIQPEHRQALALNELIEEKIMRDGLIGAGIVGGLAIGTVAVAAIATGLFIAAKGK